MKQVLKLLLVLSSLFLFSPYEAAATTYPAKIGEKMGNGLINVVTGLGEIPKSIMIANRTSGPLYAGTAGVVSGFVQMLGRTLCGATDLVTFMIPTKSMVKPDFIWQKFNEETSYRTTWEFLP